MSKSSLNALEYAARSGVSEAFFVAGAEEGLGDRRHGRLRGQLAEGGLPGEDVGGLKGSKRVENRWKRMKHDEKRGLSERQRAGFGTQMACRFEVPVAELSTGWRMRLTLAVPGARVDFS